MSAIEEIVAALTEAKAALEECVCLEDGEWVFAVDDDEEERVRRVIAAAKACGDALGAKEAEAKERQLQPQAVAERREGPGCGPILMRWAHISPEQDFSHQIASWAERVRPIIDKAVEIRIAVHFVPPSPQPLSEYERGRKDERADVVHHLSHARPEHHDRAGWSAIAYASDIKDGRHVGAAARAKEKKP